MGFHLSAKSGSLQNCSNTHPVTDLYHASMICFDTIIHMLRAPWWGSACGSAVRQCKLSMLDEQTYLEPTSICGMQRTPWWNCKRLKQQSEDTFTSFGLMWKDSAYEPSHCFTDRASHPRHQGQTSPRRPQEEARALIPASAPWCRTL